MRKRTGITIDEGTWHRFRVACRILDRNSSDVLEEIIRQWLVETKPQITKIYQELAQEPADAPEPSADAQHDANPLPATLPASVDLTTDTPAGEAATSTKPKPLPITRKHL